LNKTQGVKNPKIVATNAARTPIKISGRYASSGARHREKENTGKDEEKRESRGTRMRESAYARGEIWGNNQKKVKRGGQEVGRGGKRQAAWKGNL